MPKGKLLVISGPSAGVGKDTIVKLFLAKHPDWRKPPSLSTRKPRVGEVDGKDYIFINEQEFRQRIQEGELLEWAEVTGNLYGTLRHPVEEALNAGRNVLLRKEYRGARAIKEALPAATTVFLVAENETALEKRIRARATDDEAVIEQRLQLAKQELTHKDEFDFVVVNPSGRPEEALAAIEKAIA